jgi:hypothetical protein
MFDNLTPSKLERARAAREVATALSLFLSGKFRPPRLMLYGNAVRTALCRMDGEDSDADAVADATLLGQYVESEMLGVKMPNPEKFPAGVQVALARAANCADLWRPVISALAAILLRDGRVTGHQFSILSECSNTSGHIITGERKGRSDTIR